MRPRTPAVLPLLLLLAASPDAGQDHPCVATGVGRIVAVGDLHGAYDGFVAILRETKVLNAELAWIGGRTHLVQMGDVLDRGPDARKIFDLIRRLEAEAAAAGGAVHMLIGNHEALALMGISFDYEGFVTPEQFVSFIPDSSRRRWEEEFRRRSPGMTDFSASWKELMRTSDRARSLYYSQLRRDYGSWIARHPTVLKINRTVFVHGGLNDSYSAWPCDRINRIVTRELLGFVNGSAGPTRVVYDSRGPLWYRDMAVKPETVIGEEVVRALRNLDADQIVIAHTSTDASRSLDEDRLSRLGQRIWLIDTGIWEEFGGRYGALIYENGKFWIWGKDYEKDRDSLRPAGPGGGPRPAGRGASASR